MSEYTKTALVLGAGGFIGSHMVKRLREEGYWVRGVDLKQPEFSSTRANEFVLGDLRDASFVTRVIEFKGYRGNFFNSVPDRYIESFDVIIFVYHIIVPRFKQIRTICKEWNGIVQNLTIGVMFTRFTNFVNNIPYVIDRVYPYRVVFISNREFRHSIGEATI